MPHIWLACLLVLLVSFDGCAARVSAQPQKKLRMMIPSDVQCGCKSADIYGPLQASLERFERRVGAKVEVIRLPEAIYGSQMRADTKRNDAPDVIWARGSELAPLVREGTVVPLTSWIKDRPMRFLSFPAWIREQFVIANQIFGVPLSAEGDLRFYAYFITAASRDRGRAKLAVELIAHLSEEIPLRGLPDVALYSLEFPEENVRPGAPLPVRVRLKNLGDAPAKGFEVVFRVNGEDVAIRKVDCLKSGATKQLDVKLVRRPLSENVIMVVIDPRSLLAESNKKNNRVIIKYTGGPTGPPPTLNAVGNPFCIDSAATKTSVWDMGPKVGFDGQNYLVVWARQQTLDGKLFNHELRAARVTPSGQILDPNGVVIALGPKKYNTFSLAFNGQSFFVAWEVETALNDPGSIIEGRLISSTSGQLVLGSSVVIDDSTTPSPDGYPHVRHAGPHVASTGSNFLVVYYTDENHQGAVYPSYWKKAKLGMYARSVSNLGAVQAGKTQFLAYDDLLGPLLRPPRVEFTQGKGLVLFSAYSTTNDTYGIYAMGITLSGGMPQAAPPTLIDSVAQSVITSKPVWRWFENPRLAAGPASYLSLWESNIVKPAVYYDPDLYGTVSQAGGSFPKPTAMVQGNVEAWPGVAFDGQNFTIVYQHMVGCMDYLGGVRVNNQGVTGATAIFNTSSFTTFISDTDLAFGTSNGLAVFWKENPPSTYNGPDYSYGVCAQIIDKSP